MTSPASAAPGAPTAPRRTGPRLPPLTPPGPKPPRAIPPPAPTTASAPDRTDPAGKLTLRVSGRLHHIGTGREHARTPVPMLVLDLHVRIINAATGELIRELDTDPARDYQPLGRPPGPQPKRPRTR